MGRRKQQKFVDPDAHYFRYLLRLRSGGRSNMYGAIPYLMADFGVPREEAFRVVCRWVDLRAEAGEGATERRAVRFDAPVASAPAPVAGAAPRAPRAEQMSMVLDPAPTTRGPEAPARRGRPVARRKGARPAGRTSVARTNAPAAAVKPAPKSVSKPAPKAVSKPAAPKPAAPKPAAPKPAATVKPSKTVKPAPTGKAAVVSKAAAVAKPAATKPASRSRGATKPVQAAAPAKAPAKVAKVVKQVRAQSPRTVPAPAQPKRAVAA